MSATIRGQINTSTARTQGQARIPLTGWCSSTPVNRTSRPWNLKLKRRWSMPRQCRIVAFRSWMWTGFGDDVVAEIVGLAVDRCRA